MSGSKIAAQLELAHRERRDKRVYWASTILLFVIMLVSFIVGMFIPTENVYIKPDENYTLESGWTNIDTNRRIDENTITIGTGQMIMMKAQLPEYIGLDEGLMCYDLGLKYLVYVDGEIIYEGGTTGDVKAGKEIGYCWRFIPIDSEMGSKEITLCLINESSEVKKFEMTKLLVGTSTDLVYEIQRTSRVTVVIIVVFLILFLVLSLLAFGLIRVNRRRHVLRIIDLALLTFFVMVWLAADGSILQLFFVNGTVKYYLSHFAFIMMTFFLNAFYQKTIEKGAKLLEFIQNVYVVILVLCVILHTLDIVHMDDVFFIVHLYVMVEILIIGYLGIFSFGKSKNMSDLGLIISFVILIVFFVLGIAQYYSVQESYASVYTGIGYILFISVLSFSQVLDVAKEYRLSAKNAEFKRLTAIDNVTQGNSRTVVYDWLKKDEIYVKGNPWFLHMDLINFASVNVSHGWEKGNEVLKGIYESNQKSILDDEIQCSIGNSNFAFVLSPDRDIEEFCMEITMKMEKYLVGNWDGVHLSAKYSAVRIQKNEPFESMLDHALIAYSNRKAGYSATANCYYYNEDCRDDIKKLYNMEHQINVGMENKEFLMFLQPKVNPVDDIVEGAEALIRWKSSHYGMVSPGEFIPLAEKTGQIRDLDLYMFREVCNYLVARRNRGDRDIVISVNVSRYGLENSEFFYAYKKIIEETHVPLELIDFEFTESMAYGDTSKIDRVMSEIRENGSRLSMDDFGSGYSNLASVTNLNFDVIKLDKSLIDTGFPKERESYLLIEHLIKLFHAMGKTIVCEGVEEEEQKEALKDLGCDLIQGFYYSRPLSVEEFEKYLEGR